MLATDKSKRMVMFIAQRSQSKSRLINKQSKVQSRLSKSKSSNNLISPMSSHSDDSIGEDADITFVNEDSHCVPASSVLQYTDLFKNKDYKRLNNINNGKRNKNINKTHIDQKDRFEIFKTNKLVNRTQQNDVEKEQELNSQDIANMYLGFYFRQAYRNTVKELKDNNELRLSTISEDNIVEDENLLLNMTQKLIDDNKTHVTQSMQGLHYINSIVMGDEYKHNKVTLPPSDKTKLAIFDMDETLIHCIPDRQPMSDTGSSDIK